MSNFAVCQLENNDNIDINIRLLRPRNLASIRLKMVKYGELVDGDFTLQVVSEGSVLGQSVITYDMFNTVGATYAHGYFNFELENAVRVNVDRTTGYAELTLRLTISNHTNSDDVYMGLVKAHEFKVSDEYGEYPINADTDSLKSWFSPYSIELITYSNI